MRQRLNADAATGIHIPIAQPGWLEESGEDFFTEAGETRSIPDHSHD